MGSHAVKKTCDDSRQETQSHYESQADPHQGQGHRAAHNESEHVHPLRPECHSDSDLAILPVHHVGHHTVNPDPG